VATALVSKYGVGAVGMYLIVVSVLSLIAIMVMKETKHFDMTDI
jgi:transporter, major facilitator family protein